MHPTYTVADVVRLVGVTERTVRRDIASGALPSVKLPNGHRRFRRAEIDRYRRSRELQKPYMKLSELARLYGFSVRNLRRYVARGLPFPIVRASARRHYVTYASIAKWTGKEVLAALERDAAARERVPTRGGQAPLTSRFSVSSRPHFLLIHEVAALAGKPKRRVYHDVEKGALAVLQPSRSGRILVPIQQAEAYAGRRWEPAKHDKW